MAIYKVIYENAFYLKKHVDYLVEQIFKINLKDLVKDDLDLLQEITRYLYLN